MIAVTILGSNSALPAHGRHPTSQVVQTRNQTFLVDSGEGTQFQINNFKIKPGRINHIFISHLHGDHYFGLIGLLTSMGLSNRQQDLHIYSPKGLKEIIELQVAASHAVLPYTIHFHVIESDGILLEDSTIAVSAFRVNHRIDCFGFLFQEKKNPRKLNIDQVHRYQVPISEFEKLHQGENYTTPEGKLISNETLTYPAKPGKKYAFCADTAYYEAIIPFIKDADMIYHETTYLQDQEEKAASRFHSTSVQAARIAQKANVKKLLIGHFSSKYENLSPFHEEASEIFKNCELALEGASYIA